MGCYINPPSESKESFLLREGRMVGEYFVNRGVYNPPPKWEDIPADQRLVCLVQNAGFTAAGVVYKQSEYMAFLPTPYDQRDRIWVLVERSKLSDVSDIDEWEAR